MKSRLEHIRSLTLSEISDEDLFGYLAYLKKTIRKNTNSEDPVIKEMQVEFCYVTREVESRRKK